MSIPLILTDNQDTISLQAFIYSFVFTIIGIILIIVIAFAIYRNKKVKTHKIYIVLDGGFFQNSDSDFILTYKNGSEVDLRNIIPYKQGYVFNGFNVYKRYISSKITDEGIERRLICNEIMDGKDKNVFLMPDYDLYLVCIYSPNFSSSFETLNKLNYYPFMLTINDLISEVEHFNYDKKLFPQKINIYNDEKNTSYYYFFKEEALFMIIYEYKGICKVYLRSSEEINSLLFESTFQKEDINDIYFWYSYVVNYDIKIERFINLATKAYNDVENDITSQAEFNLIISSIKKYADPILDRSLLLLKEYENDINKEVVPEYVTKRLNPYAYEKQSNEEETVEIDGQVYYMNDLTKQEKKEINIKKSSLKLSRKELISKIKSKYEVEILNEDKIYLPCSVYFNNESKVLIFENRFGLLRLILKIEEKDYETIKESHYRISPSNFPKGGMWYTLYLDETFSSLEELYNCLDTALK